jgi:hypothetical protein
LELFCEVDEQELSVSKAAGTNRVITSFRFIIFIG